VTSARGKKGKFYKTAKPPLIRHTWDNSSKTEKKENLGKEESPDESGEYSR